jgi:hypothetical protein
MKMKKNETSGVLHHRIEAHTTGRLKNNSPFDALDSSNEKMMIDMESSYSSNFDNNFPC